MIVLFSLRNAFRRKAIALLAILGVGVGCALMTALLGVSGEAQARLNNTFTMVAANLTVTQHNRGGGAFVPSFGILPANFVTRIAHLLHAKYVEGLVADYLPPYVNLGRGASPGILIGVNAAADRAFNGPVAHVTRGRPFRAPDEVIVGADYDALGPTLLHRSFSIQGETGTVTLHVVGVFQTGDPEADRELFGNINTVRTLLQLSPSQVNSISVRADSVRNVLALAAEIRTAFAHSRPPIDVLLAQDAVKQIDATLGTVQLFLLAISVIAAVGGGMSIAVSMIMSVMERRAEFGVLKAVGWSNWNIIAGVLIESIAVGCIGALSGLVLGLVALVLLTTYVAREQVILLQPHVVGEIFAFGVVIGAAAGVYPALRAAAVRPVETLQGF